MDLKIQPSLPRRKDFRIGVLGSGLLSVTAISSPMAKRVSMLWLSLHARMNAEKAAKRHHIAKVFDTYEELLDDPSIEVLDIVVPPNAQLGLIKAACQRKTVRGILAQKPLAMDYQEALEAVQRLVTRQGLRSP
jgi:predicted dehydrogenase